MTTSTLFRWSGIAAILSGILAVVSSIVTPEVNPSAAWLYLAGAIATIFAVIGIYGVQHKEAGILGLLGFVLSLAGNQLVTASIAGTPLFDLGTTIFAVGIILLAVATWFARRFPRWVPALWLLAVVVSLPALIVPAQAGLFYLLGGLLYAAGFAGAGYVLWTGSLETGALKPGPA